MWACIPVDVSRLALVRLRQKQYTFSYFKINILNTRSDRQKCQQQCSYSDPI